MKNQKRPVNGHGRYYISGTRYGGIYTGQSKNGSEPLKTGGHRSDGERFSFNRHRYSKNQIRFFWNHAETHSSFAIFYKNKGRNSHRTHRFPLISNKFQRIASVSLCFLKKLIKIKGFYWTLDTTHIRTYN